MNGIINEATAAFAMAAMLGLVFAGIRTMLDPQVLLILASHFSGAVRRFSQMLTQAPWLPERRVALSDLQDRGARKFARMVGLLMTMLGMLGIFEQLGRMN